MTKALFTDTTRKIQETTMVDKESIDFMQKLQDKLSSKGLVSESKKSNGTTSSDPNIAAMEKIKNNLNEAMENVIEDTEVPTMENVLVRSKRDAKGIDFCEYRVDIKEEQWGKRTKNWYSVIDTEDNSVIAQDLCLFESTMGVIYALLNGKQHKWFIDADRIYTSKLSECHHYKVMAQKATEDFKVDLYETKFQTNKERALAQKKEIRDRVWRS